jgi:hypothetical protein
MRRTIRPGHDSEGLGAMDCALRVGSAARFRAPRRGGTTLAVGETCGMETRKLDSDPEGGKNSTPSGSKEFILSPSRSVGFTYGK